MNFRSKFDHQQNQKANVTNNYQGIIPDRKLTVKRGVFPYAIHANPVSKREVFRKDQHVSNKNDSFLKPLPKNTFNLFDKKVPNEKPQFEKNKPSVSTGFFGTNTQHPTTPINFKKPPNDNITFSSTTNVTRINKNVLLNKYITQQYNAVFNAKNQKPKNHVFDEKVSNEKPQFENKTGPSTSTGFFGSITPEPKTPINVKKPQNEHVTLSNASNTTEMNKNILLNEYVTEQYNAVLKAKTSAVQPKYINFDSQEALQICTYQKIGEVINQSFIEASSKFECSLGRTSSIRDHLRKFHKERRKYDARKRDHHDKNAHADPLKNRHHHEKKHAKNKTKSVPKDSNFLEKDTLSPRKGNEVRNQYKGGNDRTYRSPSQCSLPEKNYDWRNLTPSSSPDLNYNFIRNLEEKKQESRFLGKLDDRDVKHKRSPLLPTQRKNVPQNNHPKYEYKAVNSPTLFFSDTEKSIITPEVDKNKTKMPPKDNNFSLDSAIFKRKFCPEEFRNPIDSLKRTRGKSDKKKTKRKKIATPNPSYSDSTCHGVPFKRTYERNRNDEFYSKYKYSKFGLGKDKYRHRFS